ncbi:Cation-transporting P-type ATPase [Cinnamomum micranthum f. kanehirae]|uniref:Cation-transporting P-type ATPase n=1 Tax=Cinnamomum micranthum f. kanehirae TaxID=337451 RepID=A0A3S4PG22_9MAGN|nr:Cation-transporting P-type ATPase [Cinnamomum micranthum f. kanehirae]
MVRTLPRDQTIRSWWQILWNAVLHPFIVILIVLSALSYLTGDNGNGIIILILVFITVSHRFYQEFNSSKAAIKLLELLKSPVKVQRCAGRYIQTELLVQVDQTEIVPGDIIHFSPGDLFPGEVRLLTSKDLVVSQSSLTGESGTMEKIGDIIEDPSTPLLELRNICFMGTSVVAGYGTGFVVSTGSKTYMSTIFSTLGKQTPPDAFATGVRHISYALICIMLVMVPIMTVLDYYASHSWSEDSAKQALRRLAEKGVKAKVLTGDSLSLAIKVCKEVGIRTTQVITGPDVELLDNETFHDTVKKVTVFARLTSTQKLYVVQSLQKAGNHIVGFLGDGINDSLVLDAPDVGISVD